MTEQEYIDATNLAKLRLAMIALREMYVVDEQTDAILPDTISRLAKFERFLESRVLEATGNSRAR